MKTHSTSKTAAQNGLWALTLPAIIGVVSVLALPAILYADGDRRTGAAAPTATRADKIDRGLIMPMLDPARGRKLFASKGCVVCHAVNGVGGEDAPALDASTMEPFMNPFEFSARMWRGAEAMIILQRDELGEQIEFTGAEFADIIAFAHDPQEQQRFSEADIPAQIRELIAHEDEEPHDKDEADDGHGGAERRNNDKK